MQVNPVWVFIAGLVALVAAPSPWNILAGLVCLLAGLYRLGD